MLRAGKLSDLQVICIFEQTPVITFGNKKLSIPTGIVKVFNNILNFLFFTMSDNTPIAIVRIPSITSAFAVV